jgi:putative lipoic acid-binding regulatory protein
MTEEKKSLIEFPLLFPIKVMGQRVDGFVHALTVVAKSFDSNFDASTIELRDSSTGKYLGVTLHVWTTDQAHLDELYRTLSTHPMVKVVL